MDFNYKKYSLQNLENWMHDAISSAEASPREIYDLIKSVIEEQHQYFKHHADRCEELMNYFKFEKRSSVDEVRISCNSDDTSDECKTAWNSFWEESNELEKTMPPWSHSDLEYLARQKKSKVAKWVLPIEEDPDSFDCVINLPTDLLESVGWNEGDKLEWIDRKDGSFELRKVN